MSDVVEAERYLHLMRRMGTPEQIEERAKAVDRIMIEMPRIEAKLDTLINRTSSRMWQVSLMLMPIVGAGLIAWGTLRSDLDDAISDNLKQDQAIANIEAAFDAQIQRRNDQVSGIQRDMAQVDKENAAFNASVVSTITATQTLVERIDRRLEQLEAKIP